MRKILFTTILLVIVTILSITYVVYCHRIYMRLSIVNETNHYLVIKARVYFGRVGGASNVPIYVYSPDCKEYSICPPQNCKPIKVYRTDKYGFAVIEIPKITGKWILAAVADPAHRVCKIVEIEKTSVGKEQSTELTQSKTSIKISSEEMLPSLIDILKVPEYIGALIGIVILITIAFLSKLFVRSKK